MASALRKRDADRRRHRFGGDLAPNSHLGKLIHRREAGDPARCPRCDSYRLDEDIQHNEEDQGSFESTVCAACGWRSEVSFTSWADHFEGKDIAGYLASPGAGVSDRLHETPASSPPTIDES